MIAWEDFEAFLATGVNVQRRPGIVERCDVLSPAEALEVFARLEARFVKGERGALWDGIRAACMYNVPLPYWLADELLRVDSALANTEQTAHQLLGLEAALPTTAKRSAAARRQLRAARELWFLVKRLQRQAPGLSDTAAVQQARGQLGTPYSQRLCFTLFKEQDARQRAAAEPYQAVKRVHR